MHDKRPFPTIISFACKDSQPWMAYGVMGGGMQPQGQADRDQYGHGLDPQEAGDARWQHEGFVEPTGHRLRQERTRNRRTGW
jgi:gamma-glutamyltranspeptidase/glutathione hydrolase